MTPALQAIILGGGYCAEAQAVFGAMTTQPNLRQRRIYDTAIRGLISAGLWAKRDAYYFLRAQDAQAAKINVRNPGTFDLTAVNSPTFAAFQGYTIIATSYLDTGFNPTTATSPKMLQNDASYFAATLNSAALTAGLMGTNAGGNGSALFPRDGSNLADYALNTTSSVQDTVASVDGSGTWLVSRTASNLTALYQNGASLATSARASAAPASTTYVVGNALASTSRTGAVTLAGLGGSLTAGDAASEYAILSTLDTALAALA